MSPAKTPIETALLNLTCRFYVPMACLAEKLEMETKALYVEMLAIRRRRAAAGQHGEVELDCYCDVQGENTGPRHARPWFWRFRTSDDVPRYSGDHQHPPHLAFDVQRQQDLVRFLDNEKPEVLRTGIEEFPEPGAPWAEWLSLREELIDKYGDVLPVPAVANSYAERREQSAALRGAVKEMVDWGIIKDPFIIAPTADSPDPAAVDSSSSDEESEEEEPLEPPSPDRPLGDAAPPPPPHPDHRCPRCGSADAVRRKFNTRQTFSEGSTYRTLVDDRIRAFITLLHELRVSESVMPSVICGAAKIFGIELEGSISRAFTQMVLKEMAVLAKAEMGLTLFKWARDDPQSLSVCIDAASIREQKFEGAVFCKKVQNLDTSAKKKHKFLRLGLGLIELSRGSDDKKQVALVELSSRYRPTCRPRHRR